MTETNFRIVYIPAEKCLSDEEVKRHVQPYINTLKCYIESCGLKDASISFLNVKKSEDDKDYPEIEEIVFQVQAKLSKNAPNYQEFCKSWKDQFWPLSPPVLVFYENSSFINTRRSCDVDIEYTELAFGTMPYNGEFHEYASIPFADYVSFYHDTRNVAIKCWDLELKFTYNNIRHIFVNIGSSPCEVFFNLCNPPLVFRPETKRNRYVGAYNIYHRTARVKKNIYILLGLTSNGCKDEEIDIDTFGRSNVLRITFRNASEAEEIIGRIHFRCSEKPIHYISVSSVQKPKPINFDVNLPHFGCTYLLNAMFRRNFTLAAQASNVNTCVDEIRRICEENGDCLEKSLTLVLAAIDSGKLVNYWHAIERQYSYYLTNLDEINFGHYVVPEKCRMIRRITLSPTRQMLWAPEIMFSNRVLRNFDSEYALRVSFRDDNNTRLSFFAAYSDEDVFDLSIRHPMLQGIQIGDRHYEFLAWSNSQIRYHGIWMYARDSNGNTVKEIRAWMGDFSHIHSVPKCMARMGQCFSQTEDAVSVPLDTRYVRTERDIEGGFDITNGKSYCFSDGVGKISSSLAKKLFYYTTIGKNGTLKGEKELKPKKTLKCRLSLANNAARRLVFASNCQKKLENTVADLSRQLFASLGITFSKQTVWRRLGEYAV
ncbi:RNA-dependent RNA polymerase 1 [Araneus ventricosus]|uniref:RNA-dependent RNA polymerase n=1 Tax=Araneus ventricosus TaxID=182803 RepID=A0A4Y2UWM9_ARAVE|nr:RNA-dependent RNA polymerase 1 [Araneus ventricosus]